jgi:hypothetical protein
VEQPYKASHHPNSVLVFLCDVLAFAGGAGVILTIVHWLTDVLPIFQQLGLS